MPWNFRKPDGTPDPRINAFPIHTYLHARNALVLADCPGNEDIREQVYAAVYKRYPVLVLKRKRQREKQRVKREHD